MSRDHIQASQLLGTLSDFGGPVLILESEHDEVIPHETIEAYLRACRQPKYEVIPNTGHVLVTEKSKEIFVKAIIDWFNPTAVPA
jgi:pimeloyl-ACP methyl ester carboxylesterase